MAQETQATITQWCEETFGPAKSNARLIARANEEMAELIRDSADDDRHPNIPEEMADVVIVLFRVATRMGVDLQEVINAKMMINRARKWELDGTGCGYHK